MKRYPNAPTYNPRTQWSNSLPEDVYRRLCACTSKKEDILPLAQAKWIYVKNLGGYTKEDALICVLELLDCNGRFFDLTEEEYNDILSCIH